MRTRIKFCGFTNPSDIVDACEAGADALGFVLYPKSKRYVPLEKLQSLVSFVAPFVTPVLLFVNAEPSVVRQALSLVPNALLQFHGDETAAYCESFARPYIRAIHVQNSQSFSEAELKFQSAIGILCDAPCINYGGSGIAFDWSLLQGQRTKPMILSGGLNAGNVYEAVSQIRPCAIDLSSGIEEAPGKKNRALMEKIVSEVRRSDLQSAL